MANPAQIHLTRISLKINRRTSHFNYTLELFFQRSNSISTGRVYPLSGYTFIFHPNQLRIYLIDLAGLRRISYPPGRRIIDVQFEVRNRIERGNRPGLAQSGSSLNRFMSIFIALAEKLGV